LSIKNSLSPDSQHQHHHHHLRPQQRARCCWTCSGCTQLDGQTLVVKWILPPRHPPPHREQHPLRTPAPPPSLGLLEVGRPCSAKVVRHVSLIGGEGRFSSRVLKTGLLQGYLGPKNRPAARPTVRPCPYSSVTPPPPLLGLLVNKDTHRP